MKKISTAALLRKIYFDGFNDLNDDQLEFVNDQLQAAYGNYKKSSLRKRYCLKQLPKQQKTINDTDRQIINSLDFHGILDKEGIQGYLKAIGSIKTINTIERSLRKLKDRNIISEA